MKLQYIQFKQVNLADPFFDSLKADYAEFSDWFHRKADDSAYVFINDNGMIDGFLYLKGESEAMIDVVPPLPPKNRLKIGTLKINPHGTRMGERFIKKAIDHALYLRSEEIYVTIFPAHEALANLFKHYGFQHAANKQTGQDTELVLVKKMGGLVLDVNKDYPFINANSRKFLLALKPTWHSRLLPDSILNNEDPAATVTDVSHTNSIQKIYLTAMRGVENLKAGDTLLIYRTGDGQGPAHYRSVATSLCVVDEIRDINSFATLDEFIQYARSYSIFSEPELVDFYQRRKYPTIIKFTYNCAFKKRVNRAYMLDELGMNAPYWGFFQLNDVDFFRIVERGEVNDCLIINQASVSI